LLSESCLKTRKEKKKKKTVGPDDGELPGGKNSSIRRFVTQAIRKRKLERGKNAFVPDED